MILEVAVLNVREGLQNKFEQDFALAGQYISSIKGYRGYTLWKCIETENRYILLVDWVDVESHEIGFRKSQVIINGKNYYTITMTHFQPLNIIKQFLRIRKTTTNNN